MDEHREQWLGGYRLLRRLGAGGAGTVWLAEDGAGERVALKLLHPALASTEEARRRLAREATTVNQVRCTGVARVLDVEVDDSQPFVVTEFMEGPTLALRLRSGALGPREVAALASSLRHTLTAVHEARIIHRDVKPSNVILNPMGPVLIDFGIAMVQDDDRLTRTGLVSGTAGFTPPELLRGGPASVGTDWWSWAATLLEAATGRPPFGGGDPQAVMLRVLEGRPDTGGLPLAVAQQLSAALAADPSLRPDPDGVVELLSRPSAWAGAVLGSETPAVAATATGAPTATPVGARGGEPRMPRTELLGPPGVIGAGGGTGADPDGGETTAGDADGGGGSSHSDCDARVGGRGADADADRGGTDDGGATTLLPTAATEVLGGAVGRGAPGDAAGEDGAEGGGATPTVQMSSSPSGSRSDWGVDEGEATTLFTSQSGEDSDHLSGGVAPTAQMPLQQRAGDVAAPSSAWSEAGGTEELPRMRFRTGPGAQPWPGVPASGSVPQFGPDAQQSPAGWASGAPGAPAGWAPGAQTPPAGWTPGAQEPPAGWEMDGRGPSPSWYVPTPYVWRQPLPVPLVGPLLLLGLAALPVVLGAAGSVVVGVVLLLLTTIGVTHAQRELRRVRHQGVRSSDTAVALAGLPLHLLRALFSVASGLVAGGLVSGGVWAMSRGSLGAEPPELAWPLRVLSAPGVNNWHGEGSPSALLLPLWGLVVLVLLVLWSLPTSRRLREGTALVMRTLLPPRWSRAALGVLVMAVLTATWYILTGGVI